LIPSWVTHSFYALHALAHPHDGQAQTPLQLYFKTFHDCVAVRRVKRLARQRRHEVHLAKARLDNRLFASAQEAAAANGGADGATPNGSGSSADEDVVDAEVVEESN